MANTFTSSKAHEKETERDSPYPPHSGSSGTHTARATNGCTSRDLLSAPSVQVLGWVLHTCHSFPALLLGSFHRGDSWGLSRETGKLHVYAGADFPIAQMIKNLPAMQESRVWSPGWEDTVEKRMATHSSIPAWRIPWTEEPGVLQSTGSQTVGHDWATDTHMLGTRRSQALSPLCLIPEAPFPLLLDHQPPSSLSLLPHPPSLWAKGLWNSPHSLFSAASLKPWASSQTSEKSPTAFLLVHALKELQESQFSCLEEAFSTHLSSFWRKHCFTHPKYGPHFLSAISTSTFISSLHLKYRWRQDQALWILCLGKRQLLSFFFLVLITGDFSEKPSYWFYHSLTSYFQLLFEAWHWCERYFASNCLRGLINKVDVSHILPCFMRLVISPTLNI